MFNKRRNTNEKGFTLIELLLVVAIIGILSGVTLNILNSNTIRKRPRDSQRVSDLGKLQTALELYFADTRTYPTFGWSAVSVLTALTTGTYISTIPVDPSAGTGADPCASGATYYYSYSSDGTKYVLTSRTELADTSARSACASLSNWSGTMSCSVPSEVHCYGVQNP